MVAASLTTELATLAESLANVTVQVRGDRMVGGSGVIWSRDGLVITNAHVLYKNPTVILADGQKLKAEVIAQDLHRDLAALKVAATDLPTAIIGEDQKLRVGELVFALGSPWGFVGAITTGIIHRLTLDEARKTKIPRNKIQTPQSQSWVVADIQLAPGNSGGLLANAQGEVVGINTMIAGGLALAIPASEVEAFLSYSWGSGLV